MNALTPAFAAEYTDQPGQERRSQALEMLMILPYPCLLNCGANVRQLMIVLVRLRSRIRRLMASSISSIGATLIAPPA